MQYATLVSFYKFTNVFGTPTIVQHSPPYLTQNLEAVLFAATSHEASERFDGPLSHASYHRSTLFPQYWISMFTSLLMQRFGYMHASHQHQELERRGRSRTPKPTPMAVASGGSIPHPSHYRHSRNVHSTAPPRRRQSKHYTSRPPQPPPPKGKSPDRSEPGALEDAIHEAHARGDLRQCLQWVLELQGVYLDWDDPRLDTVTEDDLCFAESAGMGPDATPEERARAEQYWAMRQAEEDEAQRVWELTATEEEKAASRRLRGQLDAEQKKRDARAQYFRAPRRDKVAALPRHRPSPGVKSVLSRSLDSTDTVQTVVIRLPPRSRQEFLFPFDEEELSAVRTMWHEQGRQGFAISETLVRPPTKPPVQASDVAGPTVQNPHLVSPDASDTNTSSASTSTSSSGSAPSALFSSIHTTTSVATSISTVTNLSSPCSPSKDSSPQVLQATKPAPVQLTHKFVPVPSTESPLHQHAASVSLRETLKADRARRIHGQLRTQSAPHDPECDISSRAKSVSSGIRWLRKGGKVVEEFVDLVARLPTSYMPVSDVEGSSLRSKSCPPVSGIQTPTPPPETFIYLLPLRPPPLYPRVFPPIPTLPRSPYRPLTPPTLPTPRMRLVSNPQFLRLKALQNRVLWGLVPVSQAECEALADIERAYRASMSPGRPDVDRCGHMFTAKESLMRVAMDGLGKSALSTQFAQANDQGNAMAALWTWWPLH